MGQGVQLAFVLKGDGVRTVKRLRAVMCVVIQCLQCQETESESTGAEASIDKHGRRHRSSAAFFSLRDADNSIVFLQTPRYAIENAPMKS